MIFYIYSVLLLESLITKPYKLDANDISDWSLKNKMMKVKHVKPIREKLSI